MEGAASTTCGSPSPSPPPHPHPYPPPPIQSQASPREFWGGNGPALLPLPLLGRRLREPAFARKPTER